MEEKQHFNAIRAEANEIMRQGEALKESKHVSSEIKTLKTQYNSLRRRLESLLDDSEKDVLPPKASTSSYPGSSTKSILMEIIPGAKAIESLAESLHEEQIPEEKREKLKEVEESIEENIEPKLPTYAGDLRKSIKQYRDGDYLASALIAGRIIDVITSKIQSQIEGESIQEQVEYLEDQGIIHGGSGGKITEAMKSYRNVYAHEIGTEPSVEEAITIIAGTSHLLKKLVEADSHQELLA